MKTPPVVPGWPVVGNAWPLYRNPLQFLRDAHARYGDVFKIEAPGRSMVVLAGLEANRWMGAEGRNALESGTFWKGMLAEMNAPHFLSGIDGPDHKLLRELYRDDLTPRLVMQNAGHVTDLVRAILAGSRPGETLSCVQLTRKIASLEVNLLLSGQSALEQWSSIVSVVEYFRWLANTKTLRKWPSIALALPTFRRHRRRAERFVEPLIEKARNGAYPSGWFHSGIQTRKDHPTLFTEGDQRAHFMSGYFAGVDTVGITLTFALRELLRDDCALWNRVRTELDVACANNGGDLPAPMDLKCLPDLMGTCYEALRLYPAALGQGRHAAVDFEFAGYHIKKSTSVLAFTTATHTDSAIFPDPYRFDIERFRPPRNEHRQGPAFSPYGRGPHVCLGAGMAELMVPLTLASLIRYYDFSLADPSKEYPTVFDPSTTLPRAFKLRFDGPRQLPACGETK